MRRPLLLWASCLVLAGAPARAETYEILEGTLSVHGSARSVPLSGHFEASLLEGSVGSDLTPLLVDDFALRTGDHGFSPNPPIEFDGLRPALFLELADQINLHGDDIALVQLRSGGGLVEFGDDEVTYRFLDFRSGASGGGHAIGRLGDGALPRQLGLEGTLYEVDQTFRIERGPCAVEPTPRPPPGGGVIEIAIDPGVFIGYDDFDIAAEEAIAFLPAGGVGGVINRVTNGESGIEGELADGGEVILVDPAGVEFGPRSASTTPTLAQLGITAPAGASVSYDDVTGRLAILGEGDLFVEGTAIEVPGLTSVRIATPGDITITGILTLPAPVVLILEAGGNLVVEGEVDVPGGVVVPPPEITPIAFCEGLRAIVPADERPLGVFSLVATAARPIEIDVQTGRARSLVRPGRAQRISVAILGNDDLDVRDIDPLSLRLGPGEAEPTSRRGQPPIQRRDVDRDGHPDLLARFDVRDTGIARGDRGVCLVAETRDGALIEGCDAVRTPPARRE